MKYMRKWKLLLMLPVPDYVDSTCLLLQALGWSSPKKNKPWRWLALNQPNSTSHWVIWTPPIRSRFGWPSAMGKSGCGCSSSSVEVYLTQVYQSKLEAHKHHTNLTFYSLLYYSFLPTIVKGMGYDDKLSANLMSGK
jgi:hypothetical protein